jgi:hypothetical protein
MITPVLLEGIGWGTYLFFAALNACFFPIIYFFYPETAGRSLEEIDLIFAKGYTEKISYVKAAKELPHVDDHEIANYARRMGLDAGNDEETGTYRSSHSDVAQESDTDKEDRGTFKADRAEKQEDMLADRANPRTY